LRTKFLNVFLSLKFVKGGILMKTARYLFLVACIILMLFIVSGDMVLAAEKKYEGVTITVSACVEDVWDKVRKPLLKEFEAKTGIHVVIDDIGFNALREKQVAEMSAKTGGYDVLYTIESFMGEYQSAGFLLNLEKVMSKEDLEYVNSEFFPSLLKVCTFNGELYGVPGSVMNHSFVINKSFFEEKGLEIPKTWEELLEAAQKLNNPPNRYGMALPAGRTGTTQEMFEEIMLTTGKRTFDENWKPQYSSPEGIKTLNFWLDLYKVSPPECVNWWWLDIWNALLSGQAAISYGTTVQELQFNDPDQSKYAGNFTFIPMPVPKDRLGKPHPSRVNTVNWVITADSKNPEAAWEFVKWINSFEVKKAEALAGIKGGTFDSALKKYYDDSEILAARPHIKNMKEVLPNAETIPVLPGMPKIIDILTLRLNEAVLGVLKPEEALKKVDEETITVLEEAGFYKK
jgi:multiple sugar transport system substrate-binding protein